ncbi:MAG: hypothetical protein RB191_16130 [Terriglobia bacterium]|nr:hypothetical protein [Terriglobia bacterium]
MPQNHTPTFSPPEQRLTADMREKLAELAPLFLIELKTVLHEGRPCIQLSGRGFSGLEPLTLPPVEAKIRLLAEICDTLSRWVPFSFWEPAEVTLFALPPERIERCAASFRKRLAAQDKIKEKLASAAESASSEGVPAEADVGSQEEPALENEQDDLDLFEPDPA